MHEEARKKQRFEKALMAETWVKQHVKAIEKKVTYRAAALGTRIEDFCGWQAEQDNVFSFVTHYRNKACKASLLTPSDSVRIYPGVAGNVGYQEGGYAVCEETTIRVHGLLKRTTQWFFFSQKNRFSLQFSGTRPGACEFKCDEFKYLVASIFAEH